MDVDIVGKAPHFTHKTAKALRAFALLAMCSIACVASTLPSRATGAPPTFPSSPSAANPSYTPQAPPTAPLPSSSATGPGNTPETRPTEVLPSPSAPPAELPASAPCPPLPPPLPGSSLAVSDEATLRARAYDAAPGTTILIQPGTYHMGSYVHIVNDGVSLRGASGNRASVVLDFGGMVGGHFGVLVEADDVTIADLTIRQANDHGVSIQGNDRPVLYNLHILDIGDQLVKVNPLGNGSEDGLLACSRLEYTTAAPDNYTNGISAHDAHRWVVRDNQWVRIRTPTDDPVPAILFWSGSSDTIVERNLLVDCYQGISFGNASHGPGDHSGGIVRNNFIYASQPHDVVIEMVHASGWLVAHNTALLLNPAAGLTWGMEARFSDSAGTFAYNLTNMTILADRDGANGVNTGNVTTAASSWFVSPASGNLHLLGSASAAIDQAVTLAQVSDDYDG
ncbi:MAG: right-handed parallel beta-helix repeat-containing protein, partial [Anaerolineales bacterium]|nr:right-handed parallel beta-helix repeat-containing protein [Anaerolineales bacterium]